MFLCVEYLCFSNIPSKTDLYKYYCHRFFLGKCFRVREIKRKRCILACPMYGQAEVHIIEGFLKENSYCLTIF